MKNPAIIAALIVVFLFSVTAYTACKKDLCKDIICQNGGVCNDGSCTCPGGFTGTNCETKKDPCIVVVCQNGGACFNGNCACTIGYTGNYCENTYSAALVGMYSCTESCKPPISAPTWNSQIKVSTTDERRIVITNFGDSNEEVTAFVNSNKITLDTKSIGGKEVSGSGTVSGNKIVVTYTYGQSGLAVTCITTMIRQ